MGVGMDTHPTGRHFNPELAAAHRNFSDAVNRNLIASEIEGGVHLRDLAPGAVLRIETRNRVYELTFLGGTQALLCGHPEYCPEPTKVEIQGCTWGGSMLKARYLGRGMQMEFEHPRYRRVLTSRIVEIRER